MSRGVLRRGQRGDEGATLVLAMIFIMVVSLTVVAVVQFTSTSIRSGTAISGGRSVTYSLDAAADGAVRQVRTGWSSNQGLAPGYGGTCDDYLAPATNRNLVTVSCQGEQGVAGQYDSGGVQPTVSAANVPGVALATYAGTGEPGIALDANGEFRIHGSVAAASTIRACTNSGGNNCSSGAGSAGLRVEGTVDARQCIGDVLTYGPPYPVLPGDPAAPLDASLRHCPGGTAPVDPGYSPPFSAPPTSRTAPACPAGWLVTLLPGTYTSSAGLNALTGGGCSNRVVWFQPGNYLFNFAAASPLWTLSDASVNVVGGTPFGWSPTAATRPVIARADAANPANHACITEYDGGGLGANIGVSFAFTGASHLSIASAGGNLELCAQYNPSGQEIAVYGMPVRGNANKGTLGATSAASTAGTWTDLATSGLTVDGLEAIGSTPSGGTLSAGLTGFSQLDATALPASAIITKVVLKVAHSETVSAGFISGVSAGVTAADGTVLPVQTLAKCTSGACTDSVDLTSQLGSVAKLRSAVGAGPQLSFALDAASGKVATEAFDGAALDISWLPKAMTATGATASPAASVANVTNGLLLDGTFATTNTPASNAVITTTLTGYQQAAADLPAGAQILGVKARLLHKESPIIQALTVGGTAADGSTIAGVPVTPCTTPAAGCTDTADLTASLSSVAKLRNAAGGGPALTYAVKGKSTATGTSDLDGIRLEVTYAPPDGLGTASGCISETPYNTHDSATCAVLSAQGNNAYIALHGTIYAPSSAVDLKIMNGGTTVFGRGALVRTLRLFFNPSVVYSAANITIEVPDSGAFVRHPRIVDFWVCAPDAAGHRVSPCTDANAQLHVVAVIADPNTPAAGSLPPTTFRLWSRRKS